MVEIIDTESGRLESRDCFPKEEDLTNWILKGKHLEKLSRVVGLTLKNAKKGTAVNTRTVDLLADFDLDKVVIEVELGLADSDHFWRLLKYGCYDYNAKFMIFIADDFDASDRFIVRKLNESFVKDGMAYFMVRVVVRKITSLSMTPYLTDVDFELVEGPLVDFEAKNSEPEYLARQIEFLEYFFKGPGSSLGFLDKNSIARGKGYASCTFIDGVVLRINPEKETVTTGIQFILKGSKKNTNKNSARYNAIKKYKDEIEAQFPGILIEWREKGGTPSIVVSRNGVSQKRNWSEISKYIAEITQRMYDIFKPYIEKATGSPVLETLSFPKEEEST